MKIPRALLAEIIAHAKAAFPEECCGLLIGRRAPLVVTRIHRATNLNRERAADRYEIDPREFHRADKTTWNTEEEIVGFYHSHPNHPPRPSAFDSARAWPAYCYLIVAVNDAGEVEPRAWRCGDAPEPWAEETIEMEDNPL